MRTPSLTKSSLRISTSSSPCAKNSSPKAKSSQPTAACVKLLRRGEHVGEVGQVWDFLSQNTEVQVGTSIVTVNEGNHVLIAPTHSK